MCHKMLVDSTESFVLFQAKEFRHLFHLVLSPLVFGRNFFLDKGGGAQTSKFTGSAVYVLQRIDQINLIVDVLSIFEAKM